MANYQLSKDAENDLRHIANYTVNKWGKKQLEKYRFTLKSSFEKIGSREVVPRSYSKNLPNIFFIQAGEHFVFYIENIKTRPIIIAILHKSQDLVKHMLDRI